MNISAFLLTKSLSNDEALKISSVFKRESVHKGQRILEPDNQGKKVYFIDEGLLRSYYLKDGKDITHHFFQENAFTLPLESIFYNSTSPYGLESLEPGFIYSAAYHEIDKMAEQYPSLRKVINILLIDVLKAFSNRLLAIQFQSAQDRYRSIVNEQPDLLLRAPLGHIASYIGITQQTLSVLRAQR
jgi:CRP-like cAMP-binding protein